ncbi:MAG: MFS transporter, partial [Clostridia bacterium]
MAYLCRLNFSSAVLKIAADLEVTTTVMGTVGSLFFLSYAFGQLINGFIGDRVPSIRFLIFAVIGTGLVNFAMTLADSVGIIRFLWVLNGYFQSVFWAACNRLLSQYYGSSEHHIVSTGMSLSMVISYVLSWAVLGKLLVEQSWQCYFLIPAASALLMLMIWLALVRTEKHLSDSAETSEKISFPAWKETVKKERLIFLGVACVFLGIIKEGIGLWAPVIFLSILNGSINQSLLCIVLIPFGNFCGILFTGKHLQKQDADPFSVLRGLLTALIAAALSMVLFRWIFPPLAVLSAAAVSGLIFG